MANDNPMRRERDEALVQIGEHHVAIAYDPDGDVWYVRASSVPGLVGSAASEDELRDALPLLVRQFAMP